MVVLGGSLGSEAECFCYVVLHVSLFVCLLVWSYALRGVSVVLFLRGKCDYSLATQHSPSDDIRNGASDMYVFSRSTSY